MAPKPTKLAFLLAVLATLGDAAPRNPMDFSEDQQHATGKAIYFITNGAENAVVALPIQNDGSLAAGSSVKTGGAGAVAIDAASGLPSLHDGLFSQSSLTRAGNYIFAVNAGSNTVSMLAISPHNSTCLTMVGEPVAVPGEFPNSIAASAENQMICVATTGSKAGISCASFSHRGVGAMDSLRPFEISQTTPPKGPLNTVAHTLFSADGTKLFTMVKGDPTVNNTGFVSIFNVQREGCGPASLGAKENRMSPNGTAVLFGTTPIPGSQSLFATDASFGAAVIGFDAKGQASVVGAGKIAGQMATCWSTISRATGSAFVTDVGVDRIVEMSVKDASIIKEYNLPPNQVPGIIDIASVGNFLYALVPGNATVGPAITVMDVSGGQGMAKQAQHFDVSSFANSTIQGMVAL